MTECNCPEVILCSVCMHVCSGWKSGSVDAALIAWVSQESPSNWEGKLCLWFRFSTPWIGTWMVIEKQYQASLSERKVVNVVHYNRICFFYQSCAVSVFFLVAKFSVMTYIFPCSSCLALFVAHNRVVKCFVCSRWQSCQVLRLFLVTVTQCYFVPPSRVVECFVCSW